jgi:hypothetical protein
MGGVCSTYGGRRGAYRVWWGGLRGRDEFEDQGFDVRIILKCICRK